MDLDLAWTSITPQSYWIFSSRQIDLIDVPAPISDGIESLPDASRDLTFPQMEEGTNSLPKQRDSSGGGEIGLFSITTVQHR